MDENVKETEALVEDVLQYRDYSAEILAIIRSEKTNDQIKEELNDYHDNDIAAIVEELTAEEREKLFEVLGADGVSDVVAYLDAAGEYLSELDSEKAADVIESMDADDAVDVLDELDEDKRKELLELIEPEAKEDIELIDSYSDDEFGSIMTTNFIVIKRNITVKQAMRSLISQAAENDNISTIYVEETDGTFYGAIDLKDLIIARTDTPLEDLIITSYPFVYGNEIISETIEQVKEYSEDSIPVLSANTKQVIGVITSQSIMEAADEELSEDYAKLAGLTEEEDIKEPLLMSMKKRVPWLVALLFLSLGVSAVIGMFEGVVSQLTVIMCFQSLILGMSGNTGTQSLAVTIRVLMDSNLNFKDSMKLVLKEVKVGLLNGAILGIITFLFTGIYIYLFKTADLFFAFSTSACVALSLCVAMVVASFTGTAIPMTLKKIGIDPAVASGPLITTINDFVSVLVYYGLAWALLINLMNITG